jgi:hypothetical protein
MNCSLKLVEPMPMVGLGPPDAAAAAVDGTAEGAATGLRLDSLAGVSTAGRLGAAVVGWAAVALVAVEALVAAGGGVVPPV